MRNFTVFLGYVVVCVCACDVLTDKWFCVVIGLALATLILWMHMTFRHDLWFLSGDCSRFNFSVLSMSMT